MKWLVSVNELFRICEEMVNHLAFRGLIFKTVYQNLSEWPTLRHTNQSRNLFLYQLIKLQHILLCDFQITRLQLNITVTKQQFFTGVYDYVFLKAEKQSAGYRGFPCYYVQMFQLLLVSQ